MIKTKQIKPIINQLTQKLHREYPTAEIFLVGGIVRDTLLGMLVNYNLAIALLADTNDMLVSVLNKDNNMENVIIPNNPGKDCCVRPIHELTCRDKQS